MTQNDAVEQEAIPDDIESFRKRNEELFAEVDLLKAEVEKLRADKDQLQKRIPVKGFLLLPDDPFAAGTMRSYVKSVQADNRSIGQLETLPFTMPYSDPLARKALEVYVVRASGGGDTVRAARAKAELALFPK
jgi:hypothetical protein